MGLSNALVQVVLSGDQPPSRRTLRVNITRGSPRARRAPSSSWRCSPSASWPKSSIFPPVHMTSTRSHWRADRIVLATLLGAICDRIAALAAPAIEEHNASPRPSRGQPTTKASGNESAGDFMLARMNPREVLRGLKTPGQAILLTSTSVASCIPSR